MPLHRYISVDGYSISVYTFPVKQRPSNPLALAVLALLFERPMHPYEMAATLKHRHKHESIKLRYGSLYTVIELLSPRPDHGRGKPRGRASGRSARSTR